MTDSAPSAGPAAIRIPAHIRPTLIRVECRTLEDAVEFVAGMPEPPESVQVAHTEHAGSALNPVGCVVELRWPSRVPDWALAGLGGAPVREPRRLRWRRGRD